MNKQPEVTERTRQKFVDAFWTLAEKKPISKIAVSELTRLAGYNRCTFYEYFLDTDDLLSYIEDKLLEDVRQIMLKELEEDNSPGHLFHTIFTAMNEKIYLLAGPNGDSGFFLKLRAQMRPLIADNLLISESTPHFDYVTCFVNSAAFGLLQHWNDKGRDISAEEISTLVQKLVVGGLMSCRVPSMTEDRTAGVDSKGQNV